MPADRNVKVTDGDDRLANLRIGTLTVQETAYVLGIGQTTAYDLIRTGRFPVPVHMIGGSRKIFRSELEAYLAGNTAAAAG